jgi:vitamin B12 transporter
LRFCIYILFLLCSEISYSQILEKELEEVGVESVLIRYRNPEDLLPGLERKKIQELQVEDAGQLLQKIAGVQVKSYGGLGGLKSVSIRGLGGQHTNFVVDGFSVFPDQTGQVNFGTIQTDNIERITVLSGRKSATTAAAISSGNSVIIRTFENTFSTKAHEVRFNQKVGSFGQTDSYFAYKKGDSLNRHFISASAKYRFSKGNYPFKFENGEEIVENIRTNNQYEDLNLSLSGGYRFKYHTFLTICLRHQLIDQELPGAVILYNSFPNETLFQRNSYAHINLSKYTFEKWSMRIFGSGTINEMNYKDPGYLNEEGILRSSYLTKTIAGGLNLEYQPNRRWYNTYHMNHYLSNLRSEDITGGEVQRNHHYSVFSTRFTPKDKGEFNVHVSNQIINENVNGESNRLHYQANPFFEYRSHMLRNHMILNFFYRNSFRMPSFNEMYYNNIGNQHLSPEKAHQFSIGAERERSRNKFEAFNRFSMYVNRVNDKIVALPTQNLFLWSIQNIGKVQILGLDFSSDITYKINCLNRFNLSVNYTFQHVTDITDPTNPTYGHQVAYLPRHSGNLDFSYYWKDYGVRLSTYSNGIRYSLNENTSFNTMNGFAVLDLSVFGKYVLKKHTLNCTLSCKNILNTSYSFVRNYIMPGRNFLISLSYAFN